MCLNVMLCAHCLSCSGFRSEEIYGEDNTVILIIRVCKYMETIPVSTYIERQVDLVTGVNWYMEQQPSWLQELEGIWRRKL